MRIRTVNTVGSLSFANNRVFTLTFNDCPLEAAPLTKPKNLIIEVGANWRNNSVIILIGRRPECW